MQMNKLLGTCLLCAWAWGQQANAQESIKVGDTTRNMITYAPEGAALQSAFSHFTARTEPGCQLSERAGKLGGRG